MPCATSCAPRCRPSSASRCSCELDSAVPQDTPARREAAERERRQQQAEATIHNDPLVRDLMTQFKTARIVPGSIKPIVNLEEVTR